MRKLQEVKELNNSSDEDEMPNHTIAGSQLDEMNRLNNGGISSMDNSRLLSQNMTHFNSGRIGVSAMGANENYRNSQDFSRIFINEEDEEYKEEEDGESPDCRSI